MPIHTLDWLRIVREIRPLAEPFPESAAEVDAWMERVKEPVATKIAESVKEILGGDS